MQLVWLNTHKSPTKPTYLSGTPFNIHLTFCYAGKEKHFTRIATSIILHFGWWPLGGTRSLCRKTSTQYITRGKNLKNAWWCCHNIQLLFANIGKTVFSVLCYAVYKVFCRYKGAKNIQYSICAVYLWLQLLPMSGEVRLSRLISILRFLLITLYCFINYHYI